MRNTRADLTAAAAAHGWQMEKSGEYRTLFIYRDNEALLEVRWTLDGRIVEAIYWNVRGMNDQYVYYLERDKRKLLLWTLRTVPVELPEPNIREGVEIPDATPEWQQRFVV